jgi:CheY-like chemotaxis protein
MLLVRQVESRQGFPAFGSLRAPIRLEARKVTEASPVPSDTTPASSVLVVEDDREQRETLCAMLDLEGFEHAEAANGREALDYLNKSRAPCLVLLDLEMPVMNGWEFRAKQLAEERLSRIPVVVVTANVEGLSRRFPGAAGFLWKPLKFEKLVAVLDRMGCRKKTGLATTTPATA